MTRHRFTTASFTRSLAAAGLLAGLAVTAGAQSAAPAATTAGTTTATATVLAPAGAPSLTIRDVYDRVAAAGYRDLREIEWSDGRYEVKGRNAQGARVKLDIDGQTGAVLRERNKR